MAGLYENLSSIDEVVPLNSDGTTRVPDAVVESMALRIKNMPPNEVFYASGNDSVLYDTRTKGLTVDTRDNVLPLPTTEQQVLTNPALMRIMRVMGDRVVDGFLVDYRRIRFPRTRDTGLEYGTDSKKYLDHQAAHGTVLPLGAVYVNAGRVVLHAPEQLREDTESLMARVDAYLASVASRLYAFEHTMPVEIIRPVRPAADALEPQPNPRTPASVQPADLIGTAILGVAFGAASSVLDGLTRKPEEQQ